MVQKTESTEGSSEEGDANITEDKVEEEKTEEAKPEEESVFDEDANPIKKVINNSQEDLLINIDVNGNDLEALKQQVLEMAPLMGFEVERADIVRSQPPQQPQEQPKPDFNLSTIESTRSSMTVDMRDEIQNMIQQRVQEELKRSGVQTAPVVEEETCSTLHHGFTCDGCGMNPIKGIRFHSLAQRNYDLCQNCEKKMHHEHPMVRFRTDSHRSFAHGRGWNTVNKIMTNHGANLFNRQKPNCRARNAHVANPHNLVNFFTNGIFGGCNNSQKPKTIGDLIKEGAKNVEKAF